MTNQAKTNNLYYLTDPHSIKSIDYLSYHLKTKMIKHLSQSIILQKLK